MSLTRQQKKTLRRVLMMTLAFVFLVEAWLWDHMGAFIARVIRALPFEKYREMLVAKLDILSPVQTLGVFIVPVVVLFPFKVFALWLLAEGHFIFGILSVIAAKLIGLGVFSFLFVLCKPKLMQVRWVNWLYHKCLHWRHLAHELVRPYTRYIKRYTARLHRKSPLGRLLLRLRTRMRHARTHHES